MRIALIILHADAARGGAERYTLDLAAALLARGEDVSLLATTFAAVPAKLITVTLSAPGRTRTRRYLRMLDSLDAHLAKEKYDVIHAMLPVRRCDVYHPHAGLAVAAKMSRLKRWINPRRARFAAVEHRLLTAPDAPVVLCLSQYVKRDVQRHYELPDEKLPVLFNAVDLKYFDAAPRGTRNDRPIALMIAQDFLRKGLRQTLEALAAMEPQSRPLLRVVGKGDSGPYQRLARAMRVDRDVIFQGPVTDPRPFYRAADFFVLPTRHDPCSLVVLESLAVGLPVISTKFNGATEIMTDGQHGYVLDDPNDTRALAAAMTKMLDEELRTKMSAACLELRPRLSYEQHISRLLSIYHEIATARTKA